MFFKAYFRQSKLQIWDTFYVQTFHLSMSHLGAFKNCGAIQRPIVLSSTARCRRMSPARRTHIGGLPASTYTTSTGPGLARKASRVHTTGGPTLIDYRVQTGCCRAEYTRRQTAHRGRGSRTSE